MASSGTDGGKADGDPADRVHVVRGHKTLGEMPSLGSEAGNDDVQQMI